MKSTRKVSRDIVNHLFNGDEKSAITYCRENINSDIKDKEYQDMKSKAISEKEVWGDKCRIWMSMLPEAASTSQREWRFVCANFLVSAVLSCRTSGDIVEDALLSKSAHIIFSKLDKVERYENLSLAIYYHKRGHIERIKNNDSNKALSIFQKSLSIIEETNSLGGWHHHALLLRDTAICEWQTLRENNSYVEARDKLKDFYSRIKEINSPKSSTFASEVKCLLNFTKAKIAHNLSKDERAKEYIERCTSIMIDIGDSTIEEQIGREVMNIYND